MSDEFVKTVVLDDLPFNKPGSPEPPAAIGTKTAASNQRELDEEPNADYPEFDDTSWLT